MQRFALIGAGFIGGVHAGNLAAHPDVDFALVYDIDVARAHRSLTAYNTNVTTLDEAFDPNRNRRGVSSRHPPTPMPAICDAPRWRPPVLCEKPIDLDFDTSYGVVQYANDQGILAMVDFNRRFDRDYAELRRVVVSGGVGKVQLIQMTSRGPSCRRSTTSPSPAARCATRRSTSSTWPGGSPTRTRKRCSPRARHLTEPRLREYGDTDMSAVTLRLPSGALVQIDSARQIGYGYDERIEVLGSTGMVEARRHRAGAVSRYSTSIKSSTTVMHDRLVRANRCKLPRCVGPLCRRPGASDHDRPRPCRGPEGSGDRRGRDALACYRTDGANSVFGCRF